MNYINIMKDDEKGLMGGGMKGEKEMKKLKDKNGKVW